MVCIAEEGVDGGQPLERVSDLVFGRYSDRAVKLDGLLAYEAAGTSDLDLGGGDVERSEEHTSELQSLMRISYAVFCLKKKTRTIHTQTMTTRTNIQKIV